MTVHPGDLCLLTGLSGSSKSTLARMLAGLIPHLYRGRFSGRVVVAGCDSTSAPLWRVAGDVGLVMQNPASQVLARTAEMEVAFGLENLGLAAAEITAGAASPGSIRYRAPAGRRSAVLERRRATTPGDRRRVGAAAARARARRVCVAEHRTTMFTEMPEVRRVDLGGEEADVPPPGLSGSVPGGGRFTLAGVACTLAGRRVLGGVDLALAGGEVVAVVGPNGAGKTTFLRVLAGLQPHRGRIEGNVGAARRPPRLVPRPGAAVILGLLSGAVVVFLGVGDKGALDTFLSYAAAGVGVDVVATLLPVPGSPVACALAGAAGNLAKLGTKTLLELWIGIPTGFVVLGRIYPALTHVAFGLAGGYLGYTAAHK